MSTNNHNEKPFAFRIIDTKPRALLELENTTEKDFRCIEILTIFLKDEQSPEGGPSQAHIKFDTIKSLRPKDSVVISHRTWINGQPARDERDQMARLTVVAGTVKPYVLDISWEDPQGKACFQRIPVGH